MPRINSVTPCLFNSSCCSSRFSALLWPSPIGNCPSQRSRRPFSSSFVLHTRLRSRMFEWLNGEGAILKHHIPGSTNYLTNLKDRNASAASEEKSARDHSANAGGLEEGALSDVGGNKPFPLNPSFVSESIL